MIETQLRSIHMTCNKRPDRRHSSVLMIMLTICSLASWRAYAQNSTVTWSSAIRLATLDGLDARLSAPEAADPSEPLRLSRLTGERTREYSSVFNCREYLDAVALGFYPRSAFDVSTETDFVRDCYLLRDLKTVGQSASNNIPNWSYDLLAVLPPILEWGERNQATNSTLGWAATAVGLHGTELTAETLKAEDDSASYSLQLIGRGDFNGDSVADIAIFGQVRAKKGSYERNDYYILTRCGTSGLMSRVSAPSKPFAIGGALCH